MCMLGWASQEGGGPHRTPEGKKTGREVSVSVQGRAFSLGFLVKFKKQKKQRLRPPGLWVGATGPNDTGVGDMLG
jgi:hypothetical protein